MQIVNSLQDVTQPKYNPANSELTRILAGLREARSREAYQNATLEETKREALANEAYRNSALSQNERQAAATRGFYDKQLSQQEAQAKAIQDYRDRELAARQAADDRYFQSRGTEASGAKSEAQIEAANRAQFGFRSLQQDMKGLEAEYNAITGQVNLLSQKVLGAGITGEQLHSMLTGAVKAPVALDETVKNLKSALSEQEKIAAEADKVTSRYNQQFGIGVVLGVDRKTGRFALSKPYIPDDPRNPGSSYFQGPVQPQAAPAPPPGSRFFQGPVRPPGQAAAPAPAPGEDYVPDTSMAAKGVTGYFGWVPESAMAGKGVTSDRGFFTRQPVRPEAQPAYAPRGGRKNYVDAYLEKYGVPEDFSTEAAARPPTQAEVDAFRAARDARMVRAPGSPYFVGPVPQTGGASYFRPPESYRAATQDSGDAVPSSYPAGWPELGDAVSRAAAAAKERFLGPNDDFFKRRRDYWNSLSAPEMPEPEPYTPEPPSYRPWPWGYTGAGAYQE